MVYCILDIVIILFLDFNDIIDDEFYVICCVMNRDFDIYVICWVMNLSRKDLSDLMFEVFSRVYFLITFFLIVVVVWNRI